MAAASSSRKRGRGRQFMSATPHFVQPVSCRSLEQGRIGIPEKFVRKYGRGLSNKVTLEISTGEKWKIGLQKTDDNFWLHKGWSKFVKHFSIKEGHLITFCYVGESVFRVVVYDTTATEVEYPLKKSCRRSPDPKGSGFKTCDKTAVISDSEEESESRSVSLMEQSESEPGTETSDSGFRIQPKGGCSRRSNLRRLNISGPNRAREYSKKTSSGRRPGTEGLGSKTRAKTIVISASEEDTESHSTNPTEPSNTEPETETSGSDFSVQPRRAYSRRRNRKRLNISGPNQTRGRAKNVEDTYRGILKASTFKSRYVFFWVPMTDLYVKRGSVAIPDKFMRDNELTMYSQAVKLQVGDKRWKVKMFFYSSRGRGGSFCKGWIGFARDNQVEEGDVLLFELVRKDKVVFNVIIFRKGE